MDYWEAYETTKNIAIITSNFQKTLPPLTTSYNSIPNYMLIVFITISAEENTINWKTMISPLISNIFSLI